jgi:L-aspartate oxidase
MKILETDYLVIGSGLAGLMMAHHLGAKGRVVVASKRGLADSNSDWAQGGVAGVVDPEDSFQDHISDTLDCGGPLCDEEVVRTIVEMAPEEIKNIESMGVHFARDPDNPHRYELGQEAGHSRRRVLHSGDITGHEMVDGVIRHLGESTSIDLRPNLMAIDLVTTGWLNREGPSKCIGAYFLDRESNEILAVRSPVTVLATGGAGKVYLYTTNPDVATGDGIAMAWRAGLPIKNMEFVQFHPTCLYHRKVKTFLISEVVRGEGGRLLNTDGEPFMDQYDARQELAPRDIVARAIDDQIKKRGDQFVYLDIRHRGREFLTSRFPTIYSTCLELGIDMATDLIPVVPAAHYFCGGVETDIAGRTALPGLYAIGETSCTGLHGANRLASNSLLEAMVTASRGAEAIGNPSEAEIVSGIEIPDWRYGDAVPSDEAVVVEHNWDEIRTLMWDYVGIVRTDKRLERALRRIENLREEIREYYLDYSVTADVLELRNIIAVASLIVRSALARKESRGLHFTLDYPDKLETAADNVLRDEPGGIP